MPCQVHPWLQGASSHRPGLCCYFEGVWDAADDGGDDFVDFGEIFPEGAN